MFWRPKNDPAPAGSPASGKAAPGRSPKAAGVAPSSADPAALLAELLSKPTEAGVLDSALAQSVRMVAPGDVRGLAVLRHAETREDRVVALRGHPEALTGVTLLGPWSAGRARVVTDGADEMIAMNAPAVRALLDSGGLRGASAMLVAPLVERGRQYGALLLSRHDGSPFATSDLDTVSRWAAALTPLLHLFEQAAEQREQARQLARALADAVEADDFEATGHARAVASVAGKLAQELSLNERDREQLWFAAMLHDIGKLGGPEGHAMRGAHYLHDVPSLAAATEAIRHHHEAWDGGGEPSGLSKDRIPLLSRIVAVASAYVQRGSAAALEEDAGVRFDPRIVAAARHMEEREEGAR